MAKNRQLNFRWYKVIPLSDTTLIFIIFVRQTIFGLIRIRQKMQIKNYLKLQFENIQVIYSFFMAFGLFHFYVRVSFRTVATGILCSCIPSVPILYMEINTLV